jgi:hypothetical protein
VENRHVNLPGPFATLRNLQMDPNKLECYTATMFIER